MGRLSGLRPALTIVALLLSVELARAQGTKSCPVDTNEQNTALDISVAEVTFSGSLQTPPSEQQRIATSIRDVAHGDNLQQVIDLSSELVREGWQDGGYFMAQVNGDAKVLMSNAISQRLAVNFEVNEGQQYRFGEITFKGNKAIKDEALRAFFPITSGEMFSRKQMAAGLENLKTAYDELGYLNFIPIPNPTVDDESGTVSFEIDLDEGKQFHFKKLNLIGFDEDTRQKLLSDFPAGQVYNLNLLKHFEERHSSEFNFSSDDPWHSEFRVNNRTGEVSITLDARPCVE